MTLDASTAFIRLARARLVIHLTEQAKTCLRALDDTQIWWRPNETSNAVGNLVLHCVGSTRHYIGHVVGGRPFVRDREAEFSERHPWPGDTLVAQLEAAMTEADEVLRAFPPDRLGEMAPRASTPSTYLDVIGLQLVHYATHVGQMAFVAKSLAPEAIDDIWRKTPLPRPPV